MSDPRESGSLIARRRQPKRDRGVDIETAIPPRSIERSPVISDAPFDYGRYYCAPYEDLLEEDSGEEEK